MKVEKQTQVNKRKPVKTEIRRSVIGVRVQSGIRAGVWIDNLYGNQR